MNNKFKYALSSILISSMLIGGALINVSADMTMTDYVDGEVKGDYWTKEVVIDPLTYPEGLNKAQTYTSMDHDRYDLGIQLEAGAEIEIMQTNPNYDCPSYIKLWNSNSGEGDNATRMPEQTIRGPENNKWFKLKATQLSVPFIQTPRLDKSPKRETPKFKIRVKKGKIKKLPIFNKGDNQSNVMKQWSSNDYLLLKGRRCQILLTPHDYESVKSKNYDFTKSLEYIDSNVIDQYDKWIGLDNSTNLNKQSKTRYFYTANKNGAGSLYYTPNHCANTGLTSEVWLETDPTNLWSTYHETGHGYEGSFKHADCGMNVNEVWNNIYGLRKQYDELGRDKANQNNWMYGTNGPEKLEKEVYAMWKRHADYNVTKGTGNMTFKPRLLVLFNIVDGDGDKGLANFYQEYRKLAAQPGFKKENYKLPNLLVDYVGAPTNRDMTPCFEAFQLQVDDKLKAKFKEENRKVANFACAVVPDDKFKEAIPKLSQGHRLASLFTVVTNDEVEKLGYKGDLTVNINKVTRSGNAVKLNLMKDGKLIESKDVTNETSVKFTNKSTGTYDVVAKDANGNTVGETNYVAIKDKNSETTIDIKLNKNDVDKTKLQALYDKVGNTERIKYTPDSFESFEKELKNAKTVLDNQDATQSEIDTQYDKLKEAYDNLIKVADKTALKETIDKVTLTRAENYEEQSWKNFKNKLDKANNVYRNVNATQKDVDTANEELKKAYEALVKLEKVDKTALEKLINKANDIIKNDSDKYEYDSLKNLESVNNDAVDIYNNQDSTQKEVDQAVKDLQAAIDNLKEKEQKPEVNKDELEKLINKANDIIKNDSDKYDYESLKKLEGVNKDAADIYNNNNATQKEVDQAIDDLQKAIDGLKEKENIDKNELKKLIDKANGIIKNDSDKYEYDSLKDLEGVNKDAVNIYNDEKSTQKEVDQAVKDLQTAIDNLKEKEQKPEVNRDELKKLIDKANGIIKNDSDKYEYDSLKDLEGVNKDAVDIYNNQDSTQKEVDQAVKDLQTAIDNLKEKEEKPEVNKDELKKLIDKANGIIKNDSDKYTQDSLDKLVDINKEASDIYNDADASQKDVDQVINKLENAINNLEEKEQVNREELKKLIDKANGIITSEVVDKYTPESMKNLSDTSKKAVDIYNNTNATQDDIDQAVKDLQTAIDSLEEKEVEQPAKVNKNELEKLINKANGIITNDSNNYTKESIDKLVSTNKSAVNVYNDKNATQNQVDDSVKALEKAINDLKEKDTVDKSGLQDAIDKANDIIYNQSDKYTPDSLESLVDANKNAVDTMKKENATQEEIDKAIEGINNAINGLEKDNSNKDEIVNPKPEQPGNNTGDKDDNTSSDNKNDNSDIVIDDNNSDNSNINQDHNSNKKPVIIDDDNTNNGKNNTSDKTNKNNNDNNDAVNSGDNTTSQSIIYSLLMLLSGSLLGLFKKLKKENN